MGSGLQAMAVVEFRWLKRLGGGIADREQHGGKAQGFTGARLVTGCGWPCGRCRKNGHGAKPPPPLQEKEGQRGPTGH